jgi:hypothetical protein
VIINAAEMSRLNKKGGFPMKNTIKILRIIALIVVIFTMVTCDLEEESSGNTSTLKVVNNYAFPITRVMVGYPSSLLDKDNLSITNTQSFSIEGSWWTVVHLYAEGIGVGGSNRVDTGYLTLTIGKTTTVTLGTDGKVRHSGPQ